ncbi:hypothetical protein DVH24_040140 [Malus domestica]|uniref:Uncharacterized protein n=1 Tax=Malus domestica TaxID=3750 RepID=A0A498ISA5_MALDO|nr:hypothetical protein DVH24_040140 [Malus domestica]
MGRITAVQHLEPKQINQRITHMYNISFSSLSMEALSSLIIDAFTSLKVKLFLITQIISYFKSYSFSIAQNLIKILSPSSKQAKEAEIMRTTKKVIVDELALLDPDLYKV